MFSPLNSDLAPQAAMMSNKVKLVLNDRDPVKPVKKQSIMSSGHSKNESNSPNASRVQKTEIIITPR